MALIEFRKLAIFERRSDIAALLHFIFKLVFQKNIVETSGHIYVVLFCCAVTSSGESFLWEWNLLFSGWRFFEHDSKIHRGRRTQRAPNQRLAPQKLLQYYQFPTGRPSSLSCHLDCKRLQCFSTTCYKAAEWSLFPVILEWLVITCRAKENLQQKSVFQSRSSWSYCQVLMVIANDINF